MPHWLKFSLDLALWTAVAPLLAFFLRFETIPSQYIQRLLLYSTLTIPFKTMFLQVFGLSKQSWSNVEVGDFWTMTQCVLLGTAFSFSGVIVLFPWYPFPRSVPLIEGLLTIALFSGVRLGTHIFSERVQKRGRKGTKCVLVVGAGEAGLMIVREMFHHPEMALSPIAFLDDDPRKQKHRFLGLPVLGKLDELPKVARKYQVDEVLIAIPSASGEVIRKVVRESQQMGIPCRVLPGVHEILSGKVTVSQIRPVNLEDLIRRKSVQLQLEEVREYLKDRTILVTGAGGSIGREIVKQIAPFTPQEILLLGRGENSLFEVETNLKLDWPELRYHVIVGDVRDKERLSHVFVTYQPRVVFHTAAHKHVPMMEENPSEAVFNNVLGTKNLVELALEHGVERFVNISTDKAVNPTSVMGATKRIAEYLVQEAARKAKSTQIFVSVRFGNVLGSRGSIIPFFQKLIERGGPIPVTHPEMKRYFMTIAEATRLVLQVVSFAENGAIYILDMGEPVQIVEVVRELIRLSGLDPDRDIQITYTGIRPGEKLCEELFHADEEVSTSQHEKILITRSSPPEPDELEQGIQALFAAAKSYDGKAVREALQKLVPTYHGFPESSR